MATPRIMIGIAPLRRNPAGPAVAAMKVTAIAGRWRHLRRIAWSAAAIAFELARPDREKARQRALPPSRNLISAGLNVRERVIPCPNVIFGTFPTSIFLH